MTPYKIKNVGELGEYTRKPNTVASWTYRTEEKETEDISEQLEDLRFVFEEKSENLNKIRRLFADCTIDVCIVLYNHQKILPGFSINSRQLSFLANIGVNLDFDIYNK